MKGYLLLLGAVGMVRLFEVGYSRANQWEMKRRGATMAADPAFSWMVLLHLSVFAGSAVEVWRGKRRWRAEVGVPMLFLLGAASLLRWWVMRTLAGHWNMRVMRSTPLGVVTTGPYRWIRHPNYVALMVELAAIPLSHGAWFTALVGGIAHALVLRQRIRTEEAVLDADPAYRAAMSWKPRFIPSWLRPSSIAPSSPRPSELRPRLLSRSV